MKSQALVALVGLWFVLWFRGCSTRLPSSFFISNAVQHLSISLGSEPSIASLTHTTTHTASRHLWKPATSTWNGSMNQVSLSGKSPKFDSLCLALAFLPLSHSSSVCDIMKNRFFQRGNERGLLAEEERGRDQSASVEADNSPVCLHHQPTSSSPASQGCRNPHAGHISARLHQCLLAC